MRNQYIKNIVTVLLVKTVLAVAIVSNCFATEDQPSVAYMGKVIIPTRSKIESPPDFPKIESFKLSPDGQFFLYSEEYIILPDDAPGKLPTMPIAKTTCRLFNAETGTFLWGREFSYAFCEFSFSHPGRKGEACELIVMDEAFFPLCCLFKRKRFFHIKTGKSVKKMKKALAVCNPILPSEKPFFYLENKEDKLEIYDTETSTLLYIKERPFGREIRKSKYLFCQNKLLVVNLMTNPKTKLSFFEIEMYLFNTIPSSHEEKLEERVSHVHDNNVQEDNTHFTICMKNNSVQAFASLLAIERMKDVDIEEAKHKEAVKKIKRDIVEIPKDLQKNIAECEQLKKEIELKQKDIRKIDKRLYSLNKQYKRYYSLHTRNSLIRLNAMKRNTEQKIHKKEVKAKVLSNKIDHQRSAFKEVEALHPVNKEF